MEAGLIDTNDCVEAIIKFGSGALDDDADKRAATVELLGRAAPASLAEAIERMRDNGDTIRRPYDWNARPNGVRPERCPVATIGCLQERASEPADGL